MFAPTNGAFDKLPKGAVEGLLEPGRTPTLTKVPTYRVASGRLDGKALAAQAARGGGKTMVKTVAGGQLTVSVNDAKVMVQDERGNMAHVTVADVYQSNGVIHVVDAVLMPR